jgi:patatin-like phospholipase/acyl hydrolase
MVLAEIEQRTEKPISSLFDLIVGTSTGGILALGLVKPRNSDDPRPEHTAQNLVDLYKQNAEKIFNLLIYDRLPLYKEKYKNKGLKRVLSRYFKDHGRGDPLTRLNQALTSVIVTSYDIQRREPFYFRSEVLA